MGSGSNTAVEELKLFFFWGQVLLWYDSLPLTNSLAPAHVSIILSQVN
jgi:hypothetical protein